MKKSTKIKIIEHTLAMFGILAMSIAIPSNDLREVLVVVFASVVLRLSGMVTSAEI